MSGEYNDGIYAPDPKLAAAFERDVKKAVQAEKTENQYAGLNTGLYLASTAAFAHSTVEALERFPDQPIIAGGTAAVSAFSAYNAYASPGDAQRFQPAQFMKGLAAAAVISYGVYSLIEPTLDQPPIEDGQEHTEFVIDVEDSADVPMDVPEAEF